MEKREVPSGIRPCPWVARIAVQRLVLRDRQDGHCRHSGVYRGMTWSPLLTLVTPGPISTPTPAPSSRRCEEPWRFLFCNFRYAICGGGPSTFHDCRIAYVQAIKAANEQRL